MPSLKVDLIVDSVQSQKIAQVGDQAEQMGQKVSNAHVKSSHAIFAHMSGVEQLVFTYMRWTMIAATIAAPIYAFERALQAGLKTVDQFKLATIGIAATLTDSIKGSDAEIKSAYQNNLRYAEDMYKRVETAAAKYFASGKEMVEAWQILTNKGMLLTSQQDIDNLGVIVDRIKLSTQGQVASLQIAQEMRAVLSGQAKATDQIALMLKDRLGPSWASQLSLAVAQGRALEWIASQFQGIRVASGDIENTWESVYSTLTTTVNQVARLSFKDIYKDSVEALKTINDFLKEHSEEIRNGIQKGWEVTTWLIEKAITAVKNFRNVMPPMPEGHLGDKAPKTETTDKLPLSPEWKAAEKIRLEGEAAKYYPSWLKRIFPEKIDNTEKDIIDSWIDNVVEYTFSDWLEALGKDKDVIAIEAFFSPAVADKEKAIIDKWVDDAAEYMFDDWLKATGKYKEVMAAQLFFSPPGTVYSTYQIPKLERKIQEIPTDVIEAMAKITENIISSREELGKLDNELRGLDWSGPGRQLNQDLNAIEQWGDKTVEQAEKSQRAVETLVDVWREKIDIQSKQMGFIRPEDEAKLIEYENLLMQFPVILEQIREKTEAIKALKIEDSYKKDIIVKISRLMQLAGASESIYGATGNEQYLGKYKDFTDRILELERQKNQGLVTSEEELNILMMAIAKNYYDRYLSLMESKTNKEMSAYMKLYKAYGYQQYYDKIIEVQNKILDITEQKNRDIGLSEIDSYRLRMIQMQEFYQSRLDMIEDTGNREIAKAKEVAQAVNGYWNTPNYAGTGSLRNFMATTGATEGRVGQRFGNTAFPGMWFNSPQEADAYAKNFNITSQVGGLVKVSGPSTGGSDQWFKTFQDANKFIEDWKNGLGQTTTSMSNLSSAVDSLTSKFQSAYQSFQSFVTSRERRSWTAQDWEKEFTRLTSAFQSTTDPEAQINTLNDMLDVLKELDKISEQQLQAQKQLGEDYLKSSQSIDDFITSLKYGPQAAYTSYGGMQTQYETLKSQAGSSEGAQEFISFIQNTFLPYMKMYSGSEGTGYGKIMEGVITDLETASDVLKGKSALLALSDLLGIDLNAKWEVTPDQLFLKKDWAPEDIKLWTDNPEDMSALFHKIENWTPTQLSLWGSLFDADFMSDAGVLTWTPTQLNLWAQLFSTDVFESIKTPTNLKLWTNLFTTDALTWPPKKLNLFTEIFTTNVFDWKPETLNLWTDLFTTDALTWIPEKIDLWAKDAKIALFTKDQWASLPVTTQDLISLNLAAIPVLIQNGDMEGAKLNINNLIGLLGDAGLKGAAGGAASGTGLLTGALDATETPFNDVSTKVALMSVDVKTNLTAVADMFTALAAKMGVSLGSAGGFAEVIQKINTQTVNNTEYVKPDYIYWTKLTDRQWPQKDTYGILVPGQPYVYVESEELPNPVPYYPKAGAGALTSGLTLAGEEGRPEWITPTVEPYRSKFLHDVGADPELIAQHILRKMAPIMQTGQNQGSGGGDIVLMVDGYELGRITAKQIDSGHYEIVRAIRGRA